MGIKVPRRKPRQLLLSIIYRMHRLLPFSDRAKFRWYLDLEWIFDRLAMEMSFSHYGPLEHPFRRKTKEFLLGYIRADHSVLDLGCKYGDVSIALAERARKVVGVDHDEVAVRKARDTYQRDNLTFLHIDALEFLRSSPDRYDVLILSHILEHLDDPAAFLMTYKDHFEWIYIELPDLDRTYLNSYRKDLGSSLIYTDDDHVSEFDRDDLRELLTGCGITIVVSEYRFGVQRLWCHSGRAGSAAPLA